MNEETQEFLAEKVPTNTVSKMVADSITNAIRLSEVNLYDAATVALLTAIAVSLEQVIIRLDEV